MRGVILIILVVFIGKTALAGEREIILASTTSTQNSGLLDAILPTFTQSTGITVKVVAVGTGQALRLARNGDADALLVHHRPSEDLFIAEGFGIERRDVMYNDFVLVGPKTDPAAIKSLTSAAKALARISGSKTRFISRGDDSGTHKKEHELWAFIGTSPQGSWYSEIGAGMGAALNMASATDAYTLSDRGSWITFGNKRDLILLVSGDPRLFNPYGLILVNPAEHPHVKIDLARQFSDWITSSAGQGAIAAYQIDGKQAFCPNANNESAGMGSDQPACPVEAY